MTEIKQDDEKAETQQRLLSGEEENGLTKVKIQESQTDPSQLMDMKTQKVQGNEIMIKEPNNTKPVFSIPKEIKQRALIMQISMATLATFSAFSSGMALGFPAISLQALTNETISGVLTLNSEQGSWFASINTMACPLGGFLSACILDRVGRKRTMILINFLSIISWAMIAFTSDTDFTLMYTQLLVARFLIGINIGLSTAPPSIYSAEISYPSIRGRLTLGTSLMISLGTMLIYMLGYFFPSDWRLVSAIATAICVVSLIGIIFLPESPIWLASRSKDTQAERSLKLFRGAHRHDALRPDIDHELQELKMQVSSDKVKRNNNDSALKMLTHPEVFKPLLIMIALFAVQQFSGIFVIIVYATQFALESNVAIDPFLAAVFIGVTRVIATICVGFVMDKFGRKPPLIFSGIGMSMCMFGLVIYNGFGFTDFNWLPVIFLLLFIFTSTIGFVSIPFALIAEVFPRKAKGLGAGLSITACYVMFFIVIKLYPTMIEYMSSVVICGIYAVISFIGVVFVHFMLIETKGKTLEQIEAHFKGKKDRELHENDKVSQIS